MFRMRSQLATTAAQKDVTALMRRALSGEVEAVAALTGDRRKLPTNGEFRFFFTARVLQRHFRLMNVSLVIGSHLWEIQGEEVRGAYSKLLENVADADCQLSHAERVNRAVRDHSDSILYKCIWGEIAIRSL